MQNFSLDNKEKEHLFQNIFQEIEEKIYDEDEDIINQINEGLIDLQENDRNTIFNYLSENFQFHSFIAKGNYGKQLKQETIQSDYQNLRNTKNHDQILQLLKNSEFCRINDISKILSENLLIIQKIGPKLIDLLDFIDIIKQQKKNSQINELDFLKKLLSFFFCDKLSNEEADIFEYVIGSFLIEEVYKFEFYIEKIRTRNSQAFTQFLDLLQKKQLQLEQNTNLSLDSELSFLLKLFTQKLQESRKNLKQYFMEIFSLEVQHFSYKNVIYGIERYISEEQDFQQIYFRLTWHFLVQYSQHFFGKNNQNNLVENINKLLEIDRKTKKIQIVLNNSKKHNDEIFMYVMHRAIYFTAESENFLCNELYKQHCKFQENLQKQYQSFQFKKIQDLISTSKEDFLAFWQIIRQLQYFNLANKDQQSSFGKMIVCLWSIGTQAEIQKTFETLFMQNQSSIEVCVQYIETYLKSQSIHVKTNILSIASLFHSFDNVKLDLVTKIYQQMHPIKNVDFLLKFQEELFRENKTIESICWFLHIKNIQWFLINQVFQHSDLIKLIFELLAFYQRNILKCPIQFLYFFRKIIFILDVKQHDILKCFKILVNSFDTEYIQFLLRENSKKNIKITTINITLSTFFFLHNQLQKKNQKEVLVKKINYFISNPFYNFQKIHEFMNNGVDQKIIRKFVEAQFYQQISDELNLGEACYQIYILKNNIYEQLFKGQDYFCNFRITPFMLKQQQNQNFYPKNSNIKLEDFNISLAILDVKDQEKIIRNWIKDFNNSQKFFELIPLFFNIIKRGESAKSLVSLVHQELNQEGLLIKLNFKALFQILFNNSNEELKVMLLKFHSAQNPVPFIYQNPDFSTIKKEEDQFLLNYYLFDIFPKCYTIINFSFSKKSEKFGKTELINEVFYQQQKFEIRDFSDITFSTIDIMFDFCFNGTRNFAIADCHGQIPIFILRKILPLFKLWIIQIYTEKELEESFQNIQILQKDVIMENAQILLIIRDFQPTKPIQEILQKISENGIKVWQLQDLSEITLTEQDKTNEKENTSKKIYSLINMLKPLENVINQKDFLTICKNFSDTNQRIITEQEKGHSIIQQIENELNLFIKEEDGFYNQDCFPIRSLEYRYKKAEEKLRKQIEDSSEDSSEDKHTMRGQWTQDIEKLESLKFEQKQTKVLDLFFSIFERQNYYIVYLSLVDRLRKYSENLSQSQIYKIIIRETTEEISQLKTEKTKKKQDFKNADHCLIDQQLNELRNRLKENIEKLSVFDIGIEVFWREVILIKQFSQSQLEFNPSEKIYQMIQKGEPFEFLNRDQQQIDSSFLESLVRKFPEEGKERVLVFSIIGPQSSGKSTILNKIFGCHFWTNVGRCTQGIYVQILKVQNKQLFENYFDYILLLDTEGLQNPNQLDQEFDKKMALFILAVSDIILINVKGDLNIQFRSLVEMCVYTLGQMKKNFSFVKQLSWFFNQNDDISKKDPFFEQIKQISNNLTSDLIETENDEKFSYQHLLGLKEDNISLLGMFSWQKNWKSLQNLGVIGEWRQMQYNETFAFEAQQNGMNVIKNFITKIKEENSNEEQFISNLNYCIKNISTSWETIQKLPDLLEFTELIQYQDDKFMKVQFDKLYNQQDNFSFMASIKTQIAQSVKRINIKNIEIFDKIKKEIQQEFDFEFEKIKKKLSEQIKLIKQQRNIQKKIYQKYLKQLEQNIISLTWESRVSILEEIEIHEREYQISKGFKVIDIFLRSISTDPVELYRYQNDPKLMEDKFEQLWNEIMNKLNEEKKKVFDQFSENWLESILKTNIKYLLKTHFDQQYLDFFSQLSKTDPFLNIHEKDSIFKIFQQELSESQFIFIDNCKKNTRYYDIYMKPINEKINASSSREDLIDFCDYFSYEIQFKIIEKRDFQKYLQDNFYQELEKQLNRLPEQEQRAQFKVFCNILDQFMVTYNESKKEAFFNELIKFHFLSIVYNQKQKIFDQFKQTFEFENKELSFAKEDFNYLSKNHPKLSIGTCKKTFKFLSDLEKIKQSLQEEKIIILSENLGVKANEQNKFTDFLQHRYQNWDPSIRQKFFTEMKQKKGWNKVYSTIYEIIKKEFEFNSVNFQFYSNKNEVFTVSNSQITSIILKIQQKIEDFNKQFAKFGLLLSDVGERSIYYYSILIIWRFGCYEKWKILNNMWNQEKDKADELQKFKAEITQNKIHQSQLKAKILVDNIFQGYVDHLHKETSSEAIKDILFQEISSSEVVEKLDKILLQEFSENQEKAIQYVRDQRRYIEGHVNDQIMCESQKLVSKYTQKLKQQMNSFLNSFLHNAHLIKDQVFLAIRTKEYFRYISGNDCFYERQLYQILIGCLWGNQNNDLDNIEEQYRCIFSQKFLQISVPINLRTQNESDQEIQQLFKFIAEVVVQLQDKINKVNTECFINVSSLVSGKFDEKKLIMNGCQYSCPMCKRKCDLDHKDHNKHECLNGHYLRGMNGILIQNMPSLFTCEEIEDDAEITTFETKIVKTWKQVKEMYPEWQFRSLNDPEKHKEKMMKVWNNGIGKVLCNYLTAELKIPVQFKIKNNLGKIDEQKLHYIIMLDDSSSMKNDNRWENVKNGALACMTDISKLNKNAKVSVIIFNKYARIVIDCEQPDVQNQQEKIQLCGGLTSFSQAFKLAHQQIVNYQDKGFSQIFMLLYTDGGAEYPYKEVALFKSLPNIILSTITLIACTEELNAPTLSEIVCELEQYLQKAELKKCIQSNAVKQIWSEIVYESYHKLRC